MNRSRYEYVMTRFVALDDDSVCELISLIEYLLSLGIPLNEVNAKGMYVNGRALKHMTLIG